MLKLFYWINFCVIRVSSLLGCYLLRHNCFGCSFNNIVHSVPNCLSFLQLASRPFQDYVELSLLMCIHFTCIIPNFNHFSLLKNLFRRGTYNNEWSTAVDRWSVLPAGRTAAKGPVEAYALVRRSKYRCLDGRCESLLRIYYGFFNNC